MLRAHSSSRSSSRFNRHLRMEGLEHRMMLCHPTDNPPPVISGFDVANTMPHVWTISGLVTDANDPVAGMVVQFGGVLAKYGLSASVGSDGGFSITDELYDLETGTASAQTEDPHGAPSNVALDWVLGENSMLGEGSSPAITEFKATKGDNDRWTFSGKVADSEVPVGGMTVVFGGTLARYKLTATVQQDGTFSVTRRLPNMADGQATAQVLKVPDHASNMATDAVITEDLAPIISEFKATNTFGDSWTFSGKVTDADDAVAGRKVVFGGELENYRFSAIIQQDGTFSVTKNLPKLYSGAVTAQTTDIHSKTSNLASDTLVSADIAPVITDFKATNTSGNIWTFTGKVSDADDVVAGRKVVLGGALAQYNLTATVQKDGTFSLTKRLPGVFDGVVTAQTFDVHGVASSLASSQLVSLDAAPVIVDFKAVNTRGNVWVFSGRVLDADDAVAGRTIVFGGALAQYNLKARVRTDGTFSLTVRLPGLLDGVATAQTKDVHGRPSEVAMDTIVKKSLATPTVTV